MQEELIRKEYGGFFDILIYTGNELFEKFPDSSFKYKENYFTRIPDDPDRHNTPGGHGGSHNGDRDAYNWVATFSKLSGYDYVIWTAADAIFSDYSAIETMMDEMVSSGAVFLSCCQREGNGRTSRGPRLHNEFFVIRADFYDEIFPMTGEYERISADGSIPECMERQLGELVQKNLNGRLWLSWPGTRHEGGGRSHMDLLKLDEWDDRLTCICVENLFSRTTEFMERFCPTQLEYCQQNVPDFGHLHDVRPNYDCKL